MVDIERNMRFMNELDERLKDLDKNMWSYLKADQKIVKEVAKEVIDFFSKIMDNDQLIISDIQRSLLDKKKQRFLDRLEEGNSSEVNQEITDELKASFKSFKAFIAAYNPEDFKAPFKRDIYPSKKDKEIIMNVVGKAPEVNEKFRNEAA